MRSILSEYVRFLRENAAWWLVPFVAIAATLAVSAWLVGAGPSFIYPIF